VTSVDGLVDGGRMGEGCGDEGSWQFLCTSG